MADECVVSTDAEVVPTEHRSNAVPLVSVVVPCLNEAAALPATHKRLSAVLGGLPHARFELVYVDDGSRDATVATLLAMQQADTRVRVVCLARNFGHQVASTAGIDAACGDVVILIDADLQDPPELVVEMLERWRAGADVVYGVRVKRDGENLFKRLTAAVFYRVLRAVSETAIPVDVGDFRLMDRRVVDVLRAMPERDRFLRGMVAWVGFHQEPLPYRRDARTAGETKYPLWKMLRFAVVGIVSFSSAPLRAATWLGFATASLALVGIAVTIYQKLVLDVTVPGWAATFVALLFFSGVQLVTIGIIGEYVGRLYHEAKGRPLYVVAGRHGFPRDHDAIGHPGNGARGRDATTIERPRPTASVVFDTTSHDATVV